MHWISITYLIAGTLYLWPNLPFPPLPNLWQPPFYSPFLSSAFLDSICEDMQYSSCSIWLIALRIMSSTSYPHCCKRQDFLFFRGWVIFCYMYICNTFFIHCSVDGHFGCFNVLTTVNSAKNTISFVYIYPEVELLDHIAVLFLIFEQPLHCLP